jgi:hypothetical protein
VAVKDKLMPLEQAVLVAVAQDNLLVVLEQQVKAITVDQMWEAEQIVQAAQVEVEQVLLAQHEEVVVLVEQVAQV